jgi:hypothetical protein
MFYTYNHLIPQARPNRAFLQAFIVQRDCAIPSVNDYADQLANEHYLPGRATLTLLFVAMTAHLDGWFAGYEEGYFAGVEEGKDIVTRALRDDLGVTS